MILGLDLSRRDVACILAQDDGATIFAGRAPLPTNADSTQQWRAVIEMAQETLIRSMQPRAQIESVVLAMNARVDAKGKIEKSLGSEGWHNLDLVAGLRDNLQIANAQVFNRVVCEGAGEARFGALKNPTSPDSSSTRSSSTRCEK